MADKYSNFILLNLKTVTNFFVSLLSISLVTRVLGLEKYADIAVLLTFAASIGVFGNAVVDACVKFTLKSKASIDLDYLSQYLSSSLMLIALIFALISLIVGVFNVFSSNPIFEQGIVFVFLVLASTFFTIISGVFRVSGFYREEFRLQSVIISVSRILYLLLLYIFLSTLTLKEWAIPFAMLFSGLMLSASTYLDFRRNLSKIRLSFQQVRPCIFPEILRQISLMILVYVGAYLSLNFILVVSKLFSIETTSLVAIALSVSIGGIVLQILTSFAYISIPKIHQDVGKGSAKHALKLVKKTNSAIISSLGCGAVFLFFFGSDIMNLWLGEKISQDQVNIIVLGCIAFGLATTNVLWSHYFSALGKIGIFGFIVVAEGVTVLLTTCAIVQTQMEHVGYIVMSIPIATYFLKTLAIAFSFRLNFRHFLVNLSSILALLLGASVLVVINLFVRNLLPSLMLSIIALGVIGFVNLGLIRNSRS